MIRKVDISAVHTEVSEDLQRYIMKKLARLDTYIPKKVRPSVHIEIILKETKSKQKKQCTCEAIIHLPGENLAAKESTVNMFAAVDIVTEKLRSQLKKYKDIHISAKAGHKDSKVRGFLGKIRSR